MERKESKMNPVIDVSLHKAGIEHVSDFGYQSDNDSGNSALTRLTFDIGCGQPFVVKLHTLSGHTNNSVRIMTFADVTKVELLMQGEWERADLLRALQLFLDAEKMGSKLLT